MHDVNFNSSFWNESTADHFTDLMKFLQRIVALLQAIHNITLHLCNFDLRCLHDKNNEKDIEFGRITVG